MEVSLDSLELCVKGTLPSQAEGEWQCPGLGTLLPLVCWQHPWSQCGAPGQRAKCIPEVAARVLPQVCPLVPPAVPWCVRWSPGGAAAPMQGSLQGKQQVPQHGIRLLGVVARNLPKSRMVSGGAPSETALLTRLCLGNTPECGHLVVPSVCCGPSAVSDSNHDWWERLPVGAELTAL